MGIQKFDHLTPDQYAVLRKGETEAPFSGKFLKTDKAGNYNCAACGAKLFSSEHKFDSGSGWPSFYEVKVKGNIRPVQDNSQNMQRVEIRCKRCDSHLGHVFNDAPQTPTGMRFCVNSLALELDTIDQNSPGS